MAVPALRPLLVMLLTLPFVLLGVVSLQAPAFACSCADLSFKQQLDRAEVVFVGEVKAVTGPESSTGGNQVTYDVRADRVFKGELASPDTQVVSGVGNGDCGLGELPPGESYVFLTQGGASNICDGTALVETEIMERVQRQLGIGTRLDPPTPAAATRTRVDGSGSPDLARLAAPGAAMVLLGLLGLAVVRRVGRPRH